MMNSISSHHIQDDNPNGMIIEEHLRISSTMPPFILRKTSKMDDASAHSDQNSYPPQNLPPELLCLIFNHLDTLQANEKDILFLVEKRWKPCLLDSLSFSDNPQRRFVRACKAGHLLAVKKILNSNKDIAFDKKEALKAAATEGQEEIFKWLLADGSIDPSFNKNELIQLATQRGHTHIVRFLMGDPRVNPPRKDLKHHPYKLEELNHTITLAARNGHLEVLKVLLAYRHLSPRTQALHLAVQNGHLESVKLLLSDGRIHLCPSLLKTAASRGHEKIVKLLLTDIQINPPSKSLKAINCLKNHLEAILQAAIFGHTEVIRIFLADNRYDFALSGYDRKIINEAAKGRHHQLMTLLIKDERFKQLSGIYLNSPINQSLLDWAASNGFDDVLKVLIENPLIDPAVNDDQAIKLASKMDHVKTVELLLRQPRVNPAANKNEAFESAISNNHLDVVLTFQSSGRIKFEENQNQAICIASAKGYKEIVEVLLQNPNVDPSDRNHAAIISAVENNHPQVVDILLASGRVDPYVYLSLLHLAARKGYAEIVEILLVYLKNRDLSEALSVAVENNHPQVVILLYDKAPPSTSYSLIKLATKKCHVEIVKILLANPAIVQFANAVNKALLYAVENNSQQLVKVFRDSGKANLAIDNNYPLLIASDQNYAEVIEILLADPAVNPSAYDNVALQIAIKKNHQKIGKLISQHDTFDPSLNQYAIMTIAALNREEELFLRIISNPHFDPSVNQNEAICLAAYFDFPQAMQFLLEDGRANPSARRYYDQTLVKQKEIHCKSNKHKIKFFIEKLKKMGNASKEDYPLRTAIEQQHKAIVKLLIADGRANPAANNHELFILAIQQGNPDILKIILADKRVDPNFNKSWPLRWAIDNNCPNIVKVLLTHPNIDPLIELNTFTTNVPQPRSLIYWATKHGHAKVIEVLLKNPKVQAVVYTKEYYDQLNSYACKLEEESRKDAYKYDKDCIGNPHIKDRCSYSKRGRYYFAWQDHLTIRKLIQKNLDEYNNRLLKLHIDFISTIKTGDVKAIKRLLTEELELNPNFNKSEALGWAVGQNRIDIVELLLAQPRIDPNLELPMLHPFIYRGSLIYWAIYHGYVGVVKLLVQNPEMQKKIYQPSKYSEICNYLSSLERENSTNKDKQLNIQNMWDLIQEHYLKFKEQQQSASKKIQNNN